MLRVDAQLYECRHGDLLHDGGAVGRALGLLLLKREFDILHRLNYIVVSTRTRCRFCLLTGRGNFVWAGDTVLILLPTALRGKPVGDEGRVALHYAVVELVELGIGSHVRTDGPDHSIREVTLYGVREQDIFEDIVEHT